MDDRASHAEERWPVTSSAYQLPSLRGTPNGDGVISLEEAERADAKFRQRSNEATSQNNRN